MASSYLAGEVPYPAKFHALMAPAWINYAAARNGYLPRRIEDGFTYLDLGCGSALTLVTLAAANPQGRFIGIDLDPGHIDHGRAIATKAGLDNVDLISGDFAEIPEGELPALDFAVLHGFFSWVGPEVRRRALDMLSRKVAEGGLVLVSYNAMPGWSAVAPLREMMLAIMDRVQGTLLDKVIGARERLRRLRDGGAYLFKAVPAASDALDEILTQDPRYLAHEYFTGHWGLFYSPDVIAAMSEAGFAFCGSLPPGLNEPALALPPGLVDMAKADRPFFEMLRDFSNCERLRIDVYRRGPAAPLTGLARMHGYESLVFGTVEGAPKSRVDVTVGDRVLRLDHTQPPYSNLVAMLSEGPVGFSQLIAELSPLAPTAVLLATLDNLVDGGQFRPMARRAPALSPPRAGPQEVPLLLNRLLLGGVDGAASLALASPVAGDGIVFDPFAAFVLKTIVAVGAQNAAGHLADHLRARHLPLFDHGQIISGDNIRLRLEDEVARFTREFLPRFVQVGLIA